jgi:hypothetical protein
MNQWLIYIFFTIFSMAIAIGMTYVYSPEFVLPTTPSPVSTIVSSPIASPIPIDCQVSDWFTQQKCSCDTRVEKQIETRTVLVPERDGGKPCPELVRETICDYSKCSSPPQQSSSSSWYIGLFLGILGFMFIFAWMLFRLRKKSKPMSTQPQLQFQPQVLPPVTVEFESKVENATPDIETSNIPSNIPEDNTKVDNTKDTKVDNMKDTKVDNMKEDSTKDTKVPEIKNTTVPNKPNLTKKNINLSDPKYETINDGIYRFNQLIGFDILTPENIPVHCIDKYNPIEYLMCGIQSLNSYDSIYVSMYKKNGKITDHYLWKKIFEEMTKDDNLIGFLVKGAYDNLWKRSIRIDFSKQQRPYLWLEKGFFSSFNNYTKKDLEYYIQRLGNELDIIFIGNKNSKGIKRLQKEITGHRQNLNLTNYTNYVPNIEYAKQNFADYYFNPSINPKPHKIESKSKEDKTEQVD